MSHGAGYWSLGLPGLQIDITSGIKSKLKLPTVYYMFLPHGAFRFIMKLKA